MMLMLWDVAWLNMLRFWYFLVRILFRYLSFKWWFHFPPHLTYLSVLYLGKQKCKFYQFSCYSVVSFSQSNIDTCRLVHRKWSLLRQCTVYTNAQNDAPLREYRLTDSFSTTIKCSAAALPRLQTVWVLPRYWCHSRTRCCMMPWISYSTMGPGPGCSVGIDQERRS